MRAKGFLALPARFCGGVRLQARRTPLVRSRRVARSARRWRASWGRCRERFASIAGPVSAGPQAASPVRSFAGAPLGGVLAAGSLLTCGSVGLWPTVCFGQSALGGIRTRRSSDPDRPSSGSEMRVACRTRTGNSREGNSVLYQLSKRFMSAGRTRVRETRDAKRRRVAGRRGMTKGWVMLNSPQHGPWSNREAARSAWTSLGRRGRRVL